MSSSPDSHSPHLWCVVLAGGVGSRFWPASTPTLPKQLLPLGSDLPLIHDTVSRILPLVPQERLRILTGAHLAESIAGALPDLEPGNLLLEPRAAGTAPALLWAAAEIERRDPDAVMVSLHSDHTIQPAEAFRDLIADAARLAAHHRRLFTVGAVPSRPETGYGYIRAGARLPDPPEPVNAPAFAVANFEEKPDRSTAERYVEAGDYLWNTGIFVWRASDLLDEAERQTPGMAELIPILREGGTEEFFERVSPQSIDQGLLERSNRVAVVAATFSWDDIGTWDSLYRARTPDADENVVVGEGFTVDTRGTVLYAAGGPIVAFGVDDLVIVRTPAVTFVTRRDRVGELKALLDRLPEEMRTLG